MGHPSLSTVVCVNTPPSLHSRVRARCPSILPVAAFGFGGHDRDLDAIHQHIHFRNVLFGNNGQDELFGAVDFLLVPPGDLRANGLGRAFDGFGGDFQTRQHLHRLAARSERHLAAHHGFHASYAG